MATGLKLSLALEHYDRTLPLLEGKVKAEGIDLEVVHVGNADGRDNRFLDEYPWEVCEISVAPYLMAIDRGEPITGIPIFHRRFLIPSHMYVNTRVGIRSPQDLRGKRVGLATPALGLSVWARGDLEHDYGVPLNQVTWVAGRGERVPYPPSGIRMEAAPEGRTIDEMLVAGEVDAFFSPMLPRSFVAGAPEVGHLFADPKAEDKAYYRRNSFYPIIHIIAIKTEIVAENPWVALSLYKAFEEAQEIGFQYYNDPWWSHLAWTHMALREQRDSLGAGAWANGVSRNRAGLERFAQYIAQQGLVSRKLELKEFIAEPTLDT